MAAPLLQLTNIRLTFGGTPLFEGVDLSVALGERIALVGRNGSGKSTLLKIAAGVSEQDRGKRFADPGARIAYLPQAPSFEGFETVGAYAGADLGPDGDAYVVDRLLTDLSLSPHTPTASLSGGEARRAALVRALAPAPDILLFDEPTNHLDLPAIEWLEAYLSATRAGIVLISHDRRFLQALTNRTVWLDRGRSRHLDRGFKDFEEWRDKALEEEEAAAHKLDRKIVAEEHWVRYGVTARRKRNMRRMGLLDDMRRARKEARRAPGSVKFSVAEGSASGKRVIVAEKLSKSFGARTIIRDFSVEIARGDRVALVGPNGAGKTTLLKLLIGALAPDAGEVRLGAGLQVLSLDQRRESLKDDMRVADAVTDGRGDWVEINGAKRHAASYLKDFLFTPEQFQAPVRSLSGGERGRLALAAALAKPSNLLVLDEPTNDLDLETLDLLEETLADYPGTILLVSHDRSFIDRIATQTISPDRDGRWSELVGGYEDMIRQRGGETVPSSPPPSSETARVSQATRPANVGKAGNKLSYKERFTLERLPQEIAALESRIAALKMELDDPALYARNAERFQRTAASLAEAQTALAAAEEQWLSLEMKREAAEP